MKLFVGLGNPGGKYARNRHNVGFMAVERIAAAHGFGPWKKKFQGLAADGEIAGEKVILLAPQTYMNESGRAVGEAARFLKLDLADLLVFHDELDLAPAKIRCKLGGGNAGHNGLRSITAHLGNEYARVRIGIGHPGAKELVHHWVLNDFAKADAIWLDPLLDAIAGAAGRLARGETERFLTDVARATQGEDAAPSAKPRKKSATDTEPSTDGDPEMKSSAPRHPAGERQSKRQSALADNLKRWLAGRRRDE
jgi:PTH1 family peptidyl-tRNA hydrolase